MIRNLSLFLTFICSLALQAKAAPILTVAPGGIQGNNWVWNVSVTPDLSVTTDTPMAVELGFRLSGSALVSATDINPSQWDTPNPGNPIFGWETPDPSANNHPVGLQTNLATSEIFAAYGSVDFSTPGAKPFLQIVAKGPSNGGAASSTIQWLGSYAVGQGRIAQIVGSFAETDFDIYSGTATQQVPEPASVALVGLGAMFGLGAFRRRR